jgi:Domain of unknown function (DUF5069)
MSTPIVARDLTKQAPHSPRERIHGFVIVARAVDKCRASLAGKLGEYHYDCPLDNVLFSFKGITAKQFTRAVTTVSDYEKIGDWLQMNGTPKTAEQVKAWSDGVEASSLYSDPEKRAYFVESCEKLEISPETSTTFDWLEADDRASFQHSAQ